MKAFKNIISENFERLIVEKLASYQAVGQNRVPNLYWGGWA